MDAFDRFDFDASPAWNRYREDSVLTSDADALLLAKAKWYKRNVEESFDVDLVRRKISSGGKAGAGGGGGGGGGASTGTSSRSGPARPAPQPPQPKPTTRTQTPTPSSSAAAAAAAAARKSSRRPLSNLSLPRQLLSSLSSASPVDAAALASRLATLVTGLAFLVACLSAWLSFFGVSPRELPSGGGEPDYYSPPRRRAPASAAAFRRFALSAAASHLSALLQRFGVPPVAAAFRGGSFDPRAMGPVLSWLRQASQAADANLLFFLMLASSSPSAPAAVPSLVAALFSLLESGSSSGSNNRIGKVVFLPAALRSFLESRKQKATQTAAASELAQGLWLALSTVLGRGGGFLTAMGFWRTYAPMRLRNSPEFRAAAAALAGGAAKAARRAAGGGSGSGGVAAFFERLEARLSHSD